MRELILIRIVHTSADMGSMEQELREEAIAKIGRERWEENQRRITKFWRDVEKEIDGLNLDYSRVKLFQDGLPSGGALGLRIVEETAAKGSPNYKILKKLIEKGARLEATESPDLLRKEYDHIKAFLTAPFEGEKAEARRRYDEIKNELMEERDQFIAKTINATLRDGEIGVLFIGAAHNVVSKLPNDIKVIILS